MPARTYFAQLGFGMSAEGILHYKADVFMLLRLVLLFLLVLLLREVAFQLLGMSSCFGAVTFLRRSAGLDCERVGPSEGEGGPVLWAKLIACCLSA